MFLSGESKQMSWHVILLNWFFKLVLSLCIKLLRFNAFYIVYLDDKVIFLPIFLFDKLSFISIQNNFKICNSHFVDWNENLACQRKERFWIASRKIKKPASDIPPTKNIAGKWSRQASETATIFANYTDEIFLPNPPESAEPEQTIT